MLKSANLVISTYLFLLLAFPSPTMSAEIKIFVDVDDSEVSAEWAKPQVQHAEESSFVRRTGDWIYSLIFGDDLVSPVLIKFKQDVPKDFSFAPLHMEPPFFEKNSTFVVRLSVSKETGQPHEVRRHFSTNITKESMSDDRLPVFYQRVRASATHRVKRLNERWHKLHDYDVQSVFKYLETVRELHHRLYIVPPEEVNAAHEWMIKAIKNRKTRVNKAVGLSSAKQIVQQIHELEAYRFTKLWKSTTNVHNCAEQYPLLRAYWSKLNKVPTGVRIERVLRGTGVYKGTVLSSIARCLSVNTRCHYSAEKNPDQEIKSLMTQIDDEIKTTFNKPLRNTLISDRESLRQLTEAIHRKTPLVCSELTSR